MTLLRVANSKNLYTTPNKLDVNVMKSFMIYLFYLVQSNHH